MVYQIDIPLIFNTFLDVLYNLLINKGIDIPTIKYTIHHILFEYKTGKEASL